METIFDWASVAIFCAIAITWLSRSVNRPPFPDPVLPYGICAAGCAIGNWLGNEGYTAFAVVTLLASATCYLVVIRPLRNA